MIRTTLAAAALALPLAIGGCETTPVPPAQQLLLACEDHETLKEAIVTQGEIGTFTLKQLKMVREVTQVPSAICAGEMTGPDGEPLTTSQALKLVEDAYTDLLIMQRQQETQ